MPQVRFPGESIEQRRARALRERVHDSSAWSPSR
jgi:hypothetical protein